jgi:hypothetical protein
VELRTLLENTPDAIIRIDKRTALWAGVKSSSHEQPSKNLFHSSSAKPVKKSERRRNVSDMGMKPAQSALETGEKKLSNFRYFNRRHPEVINFNVPHLTRMAYLR